MIFLISAASMIIVSYMTPAPPFEKVENLTFATVSAEHRAESRKSWNQWDVINSGVVMLLITAAYIYFSG
jgi:SSS family solute:Na+ symporter